MPLLTFPAMSGIIVRGVDEDATYPFEREGDG
jgi:hypothetical protein